jgi:hypothetical protein
MVFWRLNNRYWVSPILWRYAEFGCLNYKYLTHGYDSITVWVTHIESICLVRWVVPFAPARFVFVRFASSNCSFPIFSFDFIKPRTQQLFDPLLYPLVDQTFVFCFSTSHQISCVFLILIINPIRLRLHQFITFFFTLMVLLLDFPLFINLVILWTRCHSDRIFYFDLDNRLVLNR